MFGLERREAPLNGVVLRQTFEQMGDRTAILVSVGSGDINPAFSAQPDAQPNLQPPIFLLLGQGLGGGQAPASALGARRPPELSGFRLCFDQGSDPRQELFAAEHQAQPQPVQGLSTTSPKAAATKRRYSLRAEGGFRPKSLSHSLQSRAGAASRPR
jgi:hypothetical protein